MSDTLIRCYFGFRSPYSRIGLNIIKAVGEKLMLVPFSGPPDGIAFSNPTDNPAKLAYYQQDVLRMCIRHSLPINLPRPFDVDFGPCNRAFVAADREGKGFAFALEVSEARWGRGENVSDLDVLKACAEKTGLDQNMITDAQSDPSVDAAFAEHRQLIETDQVFGVPFIVAGDQKYWGQDRFNIFLEDQGWATT